MSRIKVLHVVNSLCVGGIETSVINICNNIDKRKFDVYLLVLTTNKNDLYGRIDNDVSIEVVQSNYSNNNLVNIFNVFKSLFGIRRYLKNNNFEVIHTHIYQYNILPLLLLLVLSFSKRVKHFHTIHTSGLHYQKDRFSHLLKLKVESFFYIVLKTNLIAVSEEVKRLVVRNVSGYKNLEVITNSVDLTKFKRTNLRTNHDDIYNLVYVSRLVEGKNHKTLINALKLVLDEKKNVHLYLVGDGCLKDSLKHLVCEMGINNNVHFLGNVDNVVEILDKCDVGIFPSEYEGFSVALVEMMALELAIICSSIQNFKDIFLNNDNALFFDVFDYKTLSKNILFILNDRDKLNHYQKRAVALASLYSTNNIVSKLQSYYESNMNYEKI